MSKNLRKKIRKKRRFCRAADRKIGTDRREKGKLSGHRQDAKEPERQRKNIVVNLTCEVMFTILHTASCGRILREAFLKIYSKRSR